MLQGLNHPKKRWRLWPAGFWAQIMLVVLFGLIFAMGLFYSIEKGSSRQLVTLLLKQSFPFDALILEGVPGYSQPERARLNEVRGQGLSLGMFLLTGVNIADARTFFLSYFSPPPQGPAWLGWAYHPNDPEYEGKLEPIPEEMNGVDPDSAAPPSYPKDGKRRVLVGIYNTHNSESYAGNGGPERRQGENGDVVTVGETLKKALENNGIGTEHSLQIHDAADFMTSYSRSVKTAEKLLKDYPTIRILLDLHRDGLPPGVAKSTVTVKGKEVSRVLFVIGQKNPHWQKNEQLAKELIAIGEKKYPGLFVPTISYASDARYNQHLSDGALLMEFGSQLNTLTEAEGAAEAVADVLSEWLKVH